jgi:transposase-like protein
MIIDTKKKRKQYDINYKMNAVRILNDSGMPVTTIAFQLGIEQSNLHKRNKRYGPDTKNHSVLMPSLKTQFEEILVLKQEVSSIRNTVETLRNIILKTLGDKYKID